MDFCPQERSAKADLLRPRGEEQDTFFVRSSLDAARCSAGGSEFGGWRKHEDEIRTCFGSTLGFRNSLWNVIHECDQPFVFLDSSFVNSLLFFENKFCFESPLRTFFRDFQGLKTVCLSAVEDCYSWWTKVSPLLSKALLYAAHLDTMQGPAAARDFV